MAFYAYLVMMREGCFDYLLRCGPVFHQFVVDMYAKVQFERLRFIRLNQSQLRAEEYTHLRDQLAVDGNTTNKGRLVVLPSSFTGGPRYMQEKAQDAMAYVRMYGRPCLFITMTCNSKWDEIKRELKPGQKCDERHDLLARVFRQKVKILVKVLTAGNIFGPVQCYMYSIEWQKRGLPHVHLLAHGKTTLWEAQGKSAWQIHVAAPHGYEPHGMMNHVARPEWPGSGHQLH